MSIGVSSYLSVIKRREGIIKPLFGIIILTRCRGNFGKARCAGQTEFIVNYKFILSLTIIVIIATKNAPAPVKGGWINFDLLTLEKVARASRAGRFPDVRLL